MRVGHSKALLVECGECCVSARYMSKSQNVPVVLFPLSKSLRAEFGTLRVALWHWSWDLPPGQQYIGSDCVASCHFWGIQRTPAPVGLPRGQAVAQSLVHL